MNDNKDLPSEITAVLENLIKLDIIHDKEKNTVISELIIGIWLFAQKPGDGSAREQAASCQKMLDVWANIARDYATKRYRSNLINWGVLPFILSPEFPLLKVGEYLFIPFIKKALLEKKESIEACRTGIDGSIEKILLELPHMSDPERTILLAGNVINFYKTRQ